jgi:hypothetical protein
METIFIGVNTITIGSLLLAIIFTAGVVWRVEMKLDISYKFFLAAVIFLLLAEVLDLYYSIDNSAVIALGVKTLRMLFAIGFLSGVLFMRKIVRDLDGERNNEK